MKPLTRIFFSNKKTSTFCTHKVENKINFKSHFASNLRIFHVHNSSVFAARDTKLFQKLLKSRAKYEDARCRVISESLLSFDGKDKFKCKRNIQPIAAQRVKTIIQLVTAIDRGGNINTKKVKRPTRCIKSPFRIFTRSQNKFTQCCVCPEEQKPMSSEIHAEKPRRKTNIFLKRIVKKSNNRTTCVQVEAIESIDDDDCPPSKKEPCDGKELLKSLKNTLPKECRKVVQSCPKIDSSSCNDSNKLEKLKTCLPCIAKYCFKNKSNSAKNPLVQKKSSKNAACQGKISLRRKSAQAKISIFKKGTCTKSPPGVACYAKINVKKKSREKIGNKSRNSSRASNLQKSKGKEKKALKQQPETKNLKSKNNKMPQQTSDSCTCNKDTQTKKRKKKTKSKTKNDMKSKESVNNTKSEKKKNRSGSSENVAKKNKSNNTSKQRLRSSEKKKKRSAQRTKSESQVKKKSKCLPCNKCSNAGNCCEIVNQSNRKVNTGILKICTKSCATLGKKRNKAVKTTFAGTEKPKTVHKEKAEKKLKQEKKQKEEKEPKPDKKSKGEPPKKCQLVRLGSNFSLQIEFYKDKSKVKPEQPERQKEKRGKQENEKGEKPEKKRRLKNKHSVTPVAKPTKTVTKSTKTKRTCCSMCYFAKVYRLKPKFKPQFASSVSNKSFKSELSDNCCDLDHLKKDWSSSQADTHSDICSKTFSVESIVRDCYFENHYSPKSIYTLFRNNNSITKDFVMNYSNFRFLPVYLNKNVLKDQLLTLNVPTIDNTIILVVCFSILHVIHFLNVRTVILNTVEFQSLCLLVYFLLKLHYFANCVLFIRRCFIYFYILFCTFSGKGF